MVDATRRTSKRAPVDRDWCPPNVDWPIVAGRIRKGWGPDAPGIVVLSQIRAGKSHLVVRGLLPLIDATERVLIVDFKGDDPVVNRAPAQPVSRIPGRLWRGTRRGRNQWYRIVIDDDVARGQAQLDRALGTVWNEGHWVVYVDEGRPLAGRQAPDYNRPALMNRLVLRGGYKGIRTIIGTQTPSWVNRETFSQRGFAFAGHMHDEDVHKRVAQVLGNQRQTLPYLGSIRRRDWLYTDDEDQQPFWALTRAPA